MESEKEERILTPKANISQNPSTSVVSDTSLPVNFDSSKKKVETVVLGQASTIQKIAERVHWKPPCGQKLHQE